MDYLGELYTAFILDLKYYIVKKSLMLGMIQRFKLILDSYLDTIIEFVF